jgi:hypothetical protein
VFWAVIHITHPEAGEKPRRHLEEDTQVLPHPEMSLLGAVSQITGGLKKNGSSFYSTDNEE